MVAPIWAPTFLPVTMEQVQPIQGWVMLQEEFKLDQEVITGGISLVVATGSHPNTVYGWVRGIHARTAQELGVKVGDFVVYREWEGARWDIQGQVVLLVEAQHVLARCVEFE